MLDQNKLTVSASTKMSLHDRFTKLAMLKPSTGTIIGKDKALNLTRQKASAKNRRLAIQMANRPSVQAALKLKKRSIKQWSGSGKASENLLQDAKKIQSIKKRLGHKPRIDQSKMIRKKFIENGKNFNFRSRSLRQSQSNRNNYFKTKNARFKRFKSIIFKFLKLRF